MRILLCAATEMEIAPTLQAISLHENESVQLLITGIGLMASTYALTRSVVTSRPDFIIQAGVAGSLLPDEPLAQVVVVKNESVGDLGVMQNEKFYSLFDLGLLSSNTVPWQNNRLPNESDLLTQTGLPMVDGVTVNKISTSEETIGYYRNTLHVQIETMEGAALHYIALQEKIPFLQIRSLSNYIGERDKEKWRMKEAITNLNRELQKVMTILHTI